mmetsp:Transcript_2800/g.4339  ORF Transcript_2800/g.4339 Transcript_2800/m.4339 type:complete len:238 (+) Transcript_2800:51-764(+)
MGGESHFDFSRGLPHSGLAQSRSNTFSDRVGRQHSDRPFQRAGHSSSLSALGVRSDSAVTSHFGSRGRQTNHSMLANAGATAMALDNSVELIRLGGWSIQRLARGGPNSGLIYVHVASGHSQGVPPRDVLEELDMVEQPDRIETELAEKGPLFRRIVLGCGFDVPYTMARDILEALREDVSLFADVQRKFSDFPAEPCLQLDELLKTLDMSELTLEPGEVSDALRTEIGVQILLRVL